ncbi:MAG: alkaline phosphatase [Chryseobacterium sp.]|nr:MAG: alkaline phosphatase [Chryseobacterium sp.]
MKNNYLFKGLLPIAAMFYGTAQAQTLLHYWNFNNNANVASITTPTSTLLNGTINASSTGTGSADTFVDFAGGTGQNFGVDNFNARNGDVSGTHLRYNYPINGNIQFNIPTTGYNNVVVKFSTRRSGSGAGKQKWSYSLDGTTFTPYNYTADSDSEGAVLPQDANPKLVTLDFSTIAGASNNPNFKLKVEFVAGAGGSVGNNRFDNFTVDGNNIGGTDTTAPTVTYSPANNVNNASTTVNPIIKFNEKVRLIDNSPITSANAENLIEFKLNNTSGNTVPFTTTFAGNIITVIPTNALNSNQAYYLALKPNVIEDESDNAVTASTSSTFTTAGTSISLDKALIKVDENAGTLAFKINVTNPSNSTVNLVAKPTFGTADNNDYTFTSETINIVAGTSTYTVNIPIIDDSTQEQQAEYFVLSLENPVGATISGDASSTVYIIDNDKPAPAPSNQITLNYIGSFDPSSNGNSSTEIVVHDPATKRLFTISSLTDVFDIIDFSNPLTPTVIKTVDMKPYGGITSIAVKNGFLAVASPNGTDAQGNGSVVFFDINGNFLKQLTVGALPDMVTFTPDGQKVMTANEGEPNDAYTVDPEGSISIIDVSGGIANLTQSNVKTLSFQGYNAQETAFIASGGRKVKSTSTLAQDLEPEYIAISSDSQKAWVSCQENNGIIEVDLTTNTLGNIWGLGKKDMNLPGNGFDASDNNGEVLIANWPVKAYYNPDGMASFKIGNTNYLVTANEGDEKDLGGFSERTTVGANSYVLNPNNFPNASILKASHNLGRFRVTNVNGNTDSNSDFEEINALGARSFSIFNVDTKQIVYDSGDQFERYIAANHPLIFNADNEANGAKVRSRAKGPEPEGITLGTIAGQTFAFITLERTGGVMVYNVTYPNNVIFTDYKHSRMTSVYGGDNGPEGITYIAPENSGTGKAYVVIANEISGTLSMYEVALSPTLATGNVKNEKATFNIFPNPVNKGNILYFNRTQSYELYDMSGKMLSKESNALTIDTSRLSTGVYLVKTSEGEVKRVIVK